MRVLVCGGRDYKDREKVYQILDDMCETYKVQIESYGLCIIHGACHSGGADILAEDWAKSRQVAYVGNPAEWKKYGKAAGFRRNQSMLHRWRPELVIAFPGGNGTKNMMKLAKEVEVSVEKIK